MNSINKIKNQLYQCSIIILYDIDDPTQLSLLLMMVSQAYQKTDRSLFHLLFSFKRLSCLVLFTFNHIVLNNLIKGRSYWHRNQHT